MVLADLVSAEIMSTPAWISFICYTIPLNIIVLVVITPSAYLNDEISTQTKTLMKVREVYQRLVRDNDILRDSPNVIDSRIHQIAIRKLRKETRHLKGEEKW